MKKILIVEDHADIRRLIRMSLEFESYEVHEAATAHEALAAVDRLAPDLVLLDVMMPGDLDGLDACRRIKDKPDSHSRVVMLSARGMDTDRERGFAAGADAYLVKPFSPLQLIQVMEQMLAEDAVPWQ